MTPSGSFEFVKIGPCYNVWYAWREYFQGVEYNVILDIERPHMGEPGVAVQVLDMFRMPLNGHKTHTAPST